MKRGHALGNSLQAAVLLAVSWWLWPQWRPAAALVGLAALLQLLGAGLLVTRRPRLVPVLAAFTVLSVLAVVGLFAQAAVHTMLAYGPDAKAHGQLVLGGLVLALPWLVLWPGWQWRQDPSQTPSRGSGMIILLAVGAAGLPSAGRVLSTAPQLAEHRPSAAQATALAQALHDNWILGEPLPMDLVSADLLLTSWTKGQPSDTVQLQTADLTGAGLRDRLQAGLAQLPPPAQGSALVVDIITGSWPAGTPASPARATVQTQTGASSPVSLLHKAKARSAARAVPGWTLPSVAGHGLVLIVDSYLSDEQGTTALDLGWTPAPALTADSALQAAIAAGEMLVEHQRRDGRYAYVVEGPSGHRGSGYRGSGYRGSDYNLPRHAGATWFLARLARRTGDERFAQAADRGLAYLESRTQRGGQGLAWVQDQRRSDGRAWIGTTALAVLAAVERNHALTNAWANSLAASFDQDGAVRGELDVSTATFPRQPLNPYGQGQTTLALASVVRAGREDLRPTLTRAADFLDGAYAPGAAGRLVVLDEHWTCLAASALHQTLGQRHGQEICRAYLAQSAPQTPVSGDSLAIATGPAGGLAEAVVAAALQSDNSTLSARSLAFGQHFLNNQYRPRDRALLPLPQALLGGFRDGPWSLDVRMDAVQHIGCALLGIESLLRGQIMPGGLP